MKLINQFLTRRRKQSYPHGEYFGMILIGNDLGQIKVVKFNKQNRVNDPVMVPVIGVNSW